MVNKISLKNLNMSEESFDILKKSLTRFLSLRGAQLCSNDAYELTLKTDASKKEGSYTIIPNNNGADITASNDCDIHAAIGHLLCELDIREDRELKKLTKTIDHQSKKRIRGMYFASHFYNFYHTAPIEKVYEVIEDLAMQGCNSLLVWFDMHHFDSVMDKEAQKLGNRLKLMLKYANAIGMGGSFLMLGNEAFKSTKDSFKAEYKARGGYTVDPYGHFNVEICPSREGGLEEILRQRREVLEFFKDVRVDYIVMWPYDQGGCTCADCEPWGANGYLKILPGFKELAKEYYPDCEVIVSTWYFDRFIDGEWDGIYKRLEEDGLCETKYLMSFFPEGDLPDCIAKKGAPGDVKFIDFPEISMHTTGPWGGYGGVNDADFLEKTNNKCDHLFDGGFPYSEGIFESLNKFIELTCFYSGRYKTAREAVNAYAKLYFCNDSSDLADALYKMQHYTRSWDPDKDQYSCYTFVDNELKFVIKQTEHLEYIYNTFEKYNKILPESIRNANEFRLYYIRSVVDYELYTNDFLFSKTPRAKDLLHELEERYYVCEETHPSVRPLVKFVKHERLQ